MATPTEPIESRAGSRPFDFGDPRPNAVGRAAEVSHEGCVVHLDADSAPRLMWSGEDLLSVKFPAGTRVMYPNPTIPGLARSPGRRCVTLSLIPRKWILSSRCSIQA